MRAGNHRGITIMIGVVGCLILCGVAGDVQASSGVPDNAALLYYQACLNRSDLNIPEGFGRVLNGGEPSKEMCELFSRDDYRFVIEQTMAATRIAPCDWGLWVFGRWPSDIQVGKRLRPLIIFLSTHARILVANGEYSEAVEAIAALRRFGCHIGDDSYYVWVWSLTAESEAFGVTHYLLGKMPVDGDMLVRLESELDDTEVLGWHPRQALMDWCNAQIATEQASIGRYSDWKEAYRAQLEQNFPRGKGKPIKTVIENATGPEEILDRARELDQRFINAAMAILESDESYQTQHAQVVQLTERFLADAEAGEVTAVLPGAVGFLEPYYRLHVNALAQAHAVKAALTVYRIKAATGQLPESLPAGLPKDPYSGQDFAYRTTEDGFSLTCCALAINWRDDNKPRQFDFKVVER